MRRVDDAMRRAVETDHVLCTISSRPPTETGPSILHIGLPNPSLDTIDRYILSLLCLPREGYILIQGTMLCVVLTTPCVGLRKNLPRALHTLLPPPIETGSSILHICLPNPSLDTSERYRPSPSLLCLPLEDYFVYTKNLFSARTMPCVVLTTPCASGCGDRSGAQHNLLPPPTEIGSLVLHTLPAYYQTPLLTQSKERMFTRRYSWCSPPYHNSVCTTKQKAPPPHWVFKTPQTIPS